MCDLIQDICEHIGVDSVDELMETYGFDSVVPGICADCKEVYDVEPDCVNGHCGVCGKNSVKSFMILLGVI